MCGFGYTRLCKAHAHQLPTQTNIGNHQRLKDEGCTIGMMLACEITISLAMTSITLFPLPIGEEGVAGTATIGSA